MLWIIKSAGMKSYHLRKIEGSILLLLVLQSTLASIVFSEVASSGQVITVPNEEAIVDNLSTLSCNGLPDGIYVDYESQCHLYYRCEKNERRDFTCGQEMVLDIHTLSCTLLGQASPCKSPATTGASKTRQPPTTSTASPTNRAGSSSSSSSAAATSWSVLTPFNCQGKDNGVYPDFASNCRRFHICFQGVRMSFSCSPDRLFSPDSNTCDSPSNVICRYKHRQKSSRRRGDDSLPSPPPEVTTNDVGENAGKEVQSNHNHHQETGRDPFLCLPYETGFYPDFHSGCRNFYVCFKGIQKPYSCPSDLLFNPVTKSCDQADNVVCHPLSNSTGEGGGDDDASLAIPSTTTVRTNLSQMMSMYFSNQYGGKSLSHQQQHHQVRIVPSLLSSPKNRTLSSLLNCSKKSSRELFLDVGSGCRKYVSCADGEARIFQCPAGTLFNAKIRACDLKGKVNCREFYPSAKDIDVNETQQNQKYTGDSNAFGLFLNYTSSGGPTTTTAETPPPTPDDSSYLPPFDCTQRPDGFYPDFSRNCHVFYRCLHSRKYSHYCKVGQLFDPVRQICDFEENVDCDLSGLTFRLH